MDILSEFFVLISENHPWVVLILVVSLIPFAAVIASCS